MAKAFRPSVYVNVPDGYSDENNFNIVNGKLKQSFESYAEVKKRLRVLLNASIVNEVKVFRHRRGEWGEWFERWSLVNGRPEIVKQGWM